ncbi:unnamed protein product [Acanthoscelides obtectus]|uniref:Uncharacterized protein n=1 Tax=Acanthoscelides obtectus TaxID=200917 RepID=A0A9P0MDK6_ACAOB|nr:unnamed protein product [Acanthoscelides obtectus]CAK1646571.1 hypothetical protein AOBTE_LOCUS14722 [Acanthoscelides obtectus]
MNTVQFPFQIPERSQKFLPPSETHNAVPSVSVRRTPLVTFSRLELEVDTETFHNGKARLSCVANIFHLYKREKDVILEEERPRPRPSSVLGIRDIMGDEDFVTDRPKLDTNISLLDFSHNAESRLQEIAHPELHQLDYKMEAPSQVLSHVQQ